LLAGSIAVAFTIRAVQECQLDKDASFSDLISDPKLAAKIQHYFRNSNLPNADLDKVNGILVALKKLRFNDAHATRLAEEDEEDNESDPPTPTELKEQLKLVF
jgi:hypothetical protein